MYYVRIISLPLLNKIQRGFVTYSLQNKNLFILLYYRSQSDHVYTVCKRCAIHLFKQPENTYRCLAINNSKLVLSQVDMVYQYSATFSLLH